MKKLFKNEKLYRAFIFSQVFGIAIIFFMHFTSLWDFEDFFNSYWWQIEPAPENRITVICIIAPFFITKGIDWVLSGKVK